MLLPAACGRTGPPMDALTWNLLAAAAGVALVHTLLGPDHYLPFVMLARARGWSLRRTLAITLICGLGHVGSSLLLGLLGLGAGAALGWIETVEGHRGNLAGWALVAVGTAYALWGVRRARRERLGLRVHRHGHMVHLHPGGGHEHRHPEAADGKGATFWALFVVFVLGPCEPLIPLFLVPASQGRWGLAAVTGAVFSAVTLAAMLTVTGLATAGLARLPLGPLERWAHALAGGVIAASGLGVVLLGL